MMLSDANYNILAHPLLVFAPSIKKKQDIKYDTSPLDIFLTKLNTFMGNKSNQCLHAFRSMQNR